MTRDPEEVEAMTVKFVAFCVNVHVAMLKLTIPNAQVYAGFTALFHMPVGSHAGGSDGHSPQALMTTSRSSTSTMPLPSGAGAMSATHLGPVAMPPRFDPLAVDEGIQ